MRKTECKRVKKSAIVPGSYDPITNGHMFLIDYAAKKYEKVYAVIFVNPEKKYRYSKSERLEMLRAAVKKYDNVIVDESDGMQYLYAKEKGISVCVRGYRNEKDLEYERNMAEWNKNALPGYETELLQSPGELREISSTSVKEKNDAGMDISRLVPEKTAEILRLKH